MDDWLATPVEPAPHLQTDLFVKIVLALLLGLTGPEVARND